MKKLTLLAAMAAAAVSANAQYVVEDAGIQPVLDKGDKAEVFYTFQLASDAVKDLEKAGKTVIDYSLNPEAGRNLWLWQQGADFTFVGDEGNSNPGVDFQAEGHIAVTVGNCGWSGAGFNQNNVDYDGMDFTGVTDETRFHLAYCAASNPVKSLALIIFDGEGDCGSKPAKISVGPAFNDNGVVFPTVGAAPSDEWQAVDMSFGDLKKLWPTFDFKAIKGWGGNYLSFLGGGVAGTNIELDAFYLYQAKAESGISNIEMGKAEIVVTGKTVNASGAKHMALYDLTGKTVKAVDGSVLGLNGVPAGLYLVKADNTVVKVLVK